MNIWLQESASIRTSMSPLKFADFHWKYRTLRHRIFQLSTYLPSLHSERRSRLCDPDPSRARPRPPALIRAWETLGRTRWPGMPAPAQTLGPYVIRRRLSLRGGRVVFILLPACPLTFWHFFFVLQHFLLKRTLDACNLNITIIKLAEIIRTPPKTHEI